MRHQESNVNLEDLLKQ